MSTFLLVVVEVKCLCVDIQKKESMLAFQKCRSIAYMMMMMIDDMQLQQQQEQIVH